MAVNSPRQTSQLKREILVRLIKAYLSDNFEENTRLIPYDMRPKVVKFHIDAVFIKKELS